MRHRTGLRNRLRSGKGSYHMKGKAANADHYATYSAGIPASKLERINGGNSQAADGRNHEEA